MGRCRASWFGRMFRVVSRRVAPGSCPAAGDRPSATGARSGIVRRAPVRGAAGAGRASVAFVYEGVVREVVARVKYRNTRGGVAWLADAMLARMHATDFRQVDVVTWAPTTPASPAGPRLRSRGAARRAVGRQSNLPVRRLLTRPPGAAQTGARGRPGWPAPVPGPAHSRGETHPHRGRCGHHRRHPDRGGSGPPPCGRPGVGHRSPPP